MRSSWPRWCASGASARTSRLSAVRRIRDGEVVEPEQALEPPRVLLVLLQRLDEAELLVDQRGVAARQGDEHLADLRPQAGLAGRQRDRLPVQVVDRAGQLADLLVRGDVDRRDLAGVLAGTDPGDRLGELLVGDVACALAHPADRVEQQPGDEEGQQDARRAGRPA